MDENDASFPVGLCFFCCKVLFIFQLLICSLWLPKHRIQCVLIVHIFLLQVSRHKDYFDGHSWASGLWQQGNGKGQESSSEVYKHNAFCVRCARFLVVLACM